MMLKINVFVKGLDKARVFKEDSKYAYMTTKDIKLKEDVSRITIQAYPLKANEEVEIYRDDYEFCQKLKIGDTVYYKGLGYIFKTSVFDIERGVYLLNDGSKVDDRGLGYTVFTDVDEANKSISDSYMAGYYVE